MCEVILGIVTVYYKTYCFAFQKRLFCNVKPMLLPCKTATIAMQK